MKNKMKFRWPLIIVMVFALSTLTPAGAAQAPADPQARGIMAVMSQAFEAAGNKDAAVRQYRAIIQREGEQSEWGSMAKERLLLLSK